MSKTAAIHTAISLQLAADGKEPLTLRQHLQDPLGQAARYTIETVRGFLANVAFRLRNDTPSLTFDWRGLNPATCLSDELWVLESAIADVTSVAKEASKEGK